MTLSKKSLDPSNDSTYDVFVSYYQCKNLFKIEFTLSTTIMAFERHMTQKMSFSLARYIFVGQLSRRKLGHTNQKQSINNKSFGGGHLFRLEDFAFSCINHGAVPDFVCPGECQLPARAHPRQAPGTWAYPGLGKQGQLLDIV